MTVLTEAPEGVDIIDIDAARAARAEARAASGGKASYVKVGAGYVELKPEVDVLSAEDFSAGRIRVGLSKILADPEDIDTLVASGISAPDLDLIIKRITGQSLGE